MSRVDATEVDELDDVQRFLVMLKPDRRRRFRELVVGAKRLPDPGAHERVWAFVAEVAGSADETKTRGTRVQQEAPPAGEARYALVDHDGPHECRGSTDTTLKQGSDPCLRVVSTGAWLGFRFLAEQFGGDG